MKLQLVIGILTLLFGISSIMGVAVYASEQTLEATIVSFQENAGNLVLEINTGTMVGRRIVVPINTNSINQPDYRVGQRVIVSAMQDVEGQEVFYITDTVRRLPLLILFLTFFAVTVVIARWRGITSMLGMALSFFIIFQFVLPQILSGANPVLIAIIGSLIIIPITFYLSHGLNQKTTVAVIGTLITLIITGILATIFVEAAALSGFASEEATFIQSMRPDVINIKGLLLAGIIIGVLGILDDVSVSQASIVNRLKKTNPKLSARELYSQAMDVGRDHISSMVNTLILVYAGASLPLLLLFIDTPRPFLEVINYEIIADEIVRTLVGSIGLILTVPITTIIAATVFSKTHAPAKSKA
jgi:uncharacterized membrane protein